MISTKSEIPQSHVLKALEENGLDRRPANWDSYFDDVTEANVRRQIAEPIAPFSLRRLKTLISPAALPYLEQMAQAAVRVTRQRFGNTINLYAPVYVSNFCINRCKYCGFNATHDLPRKRLTVDEAVREGEAVAREGFRDLLLVAGEDPKYVTPEYLCEIAARLRKHFSSISIEIAPQSEESYRIMERGGIEGVTLYQETYDRELYREYHPKGPKSDYVGRIVMQEAAARAGMRRLGIGALLGINDWRYETMALGLHAHVLIKHYWQSKVSVSFPRIRPAPDVMDNFPYYVNDRSLVQMILALRLTFSDIGMSLSTRESGEMRNHVLPMGITHMSAGSKTNPGGYEVDVDATEQFVISDERSVAEVSEYLRTRGFDPVWKDFDPAFLDSGEAVTQDS